MSGVDLAVALDSNVAIAVLNARTGIESWLQGLGPVYLPAPVLGELRYGALGSGRPIENLQNVDMLAQRCRILAVGQETTQIYAELRLALKRKGMPIPENDVWIAATCVENALPLATLDHHFQAVERLVVVRPPI